MNDFAEVIENPESKLFLVKKIAKDEIRLDFESEVVYNYKGFQFFTIDLKNTPSDKLAAILNECEKIEKSCWHAQESFSEYAKNRDLLTYVVNKGKIVGFQISSYWIMEKYFIFDLDETMVLKECRGNNLAMALSAVNCRTFYLRISKIKNIKKMTFISITPNLRLINLLDRLRYIIRFLDNTFNPSPGLMKIQEYIIEKKGATLVHEDYPFFLKGVFPGSLNPGDCSQKTSKRIQRMMPPDLDFHSRGDAFLILSCFGKIRLWPIMVVLLFKALGPGILLNKKLGLLTKKKFEHVNKFLGFDKSITIERRNVDRRKKIQSGIPDNADFVERRKFDRRAAVVFK